MGKWYNLLIELETLKNLPSAADKNPQLKFVRTISINKAYPKRKDGRCRRCEKKLTGKRTAWCSDVCTEDALIRCSHSRAAKYLRMRDKCICALCGTDTKKVKIPGRRRAWEIDHCTPVVSGGGHCGIDGLRSLCIPCHKAETKALRGRMKADKDCKK